ncbi:MAG TPA: SUMF1/EgtB/PvdO family nonheme iron enzyme [Solirubrobacteraceae bacterium]|nr:SUMF1/EgtB/PvdO family nonheme iron enzyme [Solirubrobacteraceae bacterium]
MAIDALKSSRLSADAVQALNGLEAARERTLALVAHLDDEQLRRVHSPLMSPLVWDLGHIAAYEDLWIAHRHGELELLRPQLADLYDAFETPRAVRGDIEVLGPRDARAYLEAVRTRTVETIAERGVGDGLVCEMVIRHELQHGETMRQALAIAGLLAPSESAAADRPMQDGEAAMEWIGMPPGAFAMGASDDGFSYDNERPRHSVQTGAFQIARRPASNAALRAFAEQGGYERRELWSEEGWAWLGEQDQAQHPAIAAGHPLAAASHVCWFEADAFARAHDARLPTEAEWENAATSAPLAELGRVWEWTQTAFHGYPGFVAHPYREYSEVFFGEDYRVLRGGSWATDARVANPRFRNWDLPQRRQIFAGVRLARDIAHGADEQPARGQAQTR